MSTRAYILINARRDSAHRIREYLQALPDKILAVDIVMGPCDLVAVVEVGSVPELSEFLRHRIHTFEDVERTTTCIACDGWGAEG